MRCQSPSSSQANAVHVLFTVSRRSASAQATAAEHNGTPSLLRGIWMRRPVAEMMSQGSRLERAEVTLLHRVWIRLVIPG